MKRRIIIGVDAGSEKSGIVVVTQDGIREAMNLENDKVYDFIYNEYWNAIGDHWELDLRVVIEDAVIYSGTRAGGDVVRTIKFIGILEWRLKEASNNGNRFKLKLVERWQVKQWVFLQFRSMCELEIQKNMARNDARERRKLNEIIDADKISEKKRSEAVDRLSFLENRKPLPITFVYVDDRIVQRAMRIRWNIEKPKVGQKAAHGLKDHSWQALGAVSYFMALK